MKGIRRVFLIMIVAAILLVTAGCATRNESKLESGDITKENLPAVCDILKAGGLSNTDIFGQWVQGYLNGDADNGDASGFTDADCRMTVMLLAGDSISGADLDGNYEGTYLMFDVEAIENQETFKVLQDKKQLFTTLFGEMPIPVSGFEDAFPDNLKEHGIRFNGEGFFVISILFKAYEEEYAFVGHTGLLIDCRKIDAVDTDYLFVEKIAFNDAYKVTKIRDENELIQILAERPDYFVEEGEPKPLVYKNDERIGELSSN